MWFTDVVTPVGSMRLLKEGDALVGAYLDGQKHAPGDVTAWRTAPERFVEEARQIAAYFAGERTRFDLPLTLAGTPFQRRVWEALRAIPFGETRSYGDIARAVGSPGAFRAVGLANAKNPVTIVVPCHRVVGADGSLTGYAGGMERKRWLLDWERQVGAGLEAGRGVQRSQISAPGRMQAVSPTITSV